MPVLPALAGDQLPAIATAGINTHVLGVAVATMVLTGVVFGLAPAVQGRGSRLRRGAARRNGWKELRRVTKPHS